MSDRTSSADSHGTARVYSEPNAALEHARATLESASATDADRVAAWLTLGRSAYYANRMSDAVALLRRAAELARSPAVLTDVLLMLAPALSKEGHPDEALTLLENPALSLQPEHAGQLRNQRGIILTELGRLPEAVAEMTAALDLLREAGDGDREARTLVNLGAVSSMMGRLDDAERWYSLARERTIATGQHVVTAGIEGNLGYVESRRGNFSRALEWYGGARQTFEDLGDVGLLVAVLEIDHARTLLDVGLAADAVEAAGRACASATAGGNQMLETQGRLLLTEALIDVGDRRAAADALARGDELARRLGQRPWQLRATALRSELDGETSGGHPGGVDREIDEFLAAGWAREAYEHALAHATARRETDPSGARALLRQIDQRAAEFDVDPVRRAHAALLVAEIDEDLPGLQSAFDDALERLAEQRDLMASIEMRATLAARVRPIRAVAIRAALRADRPADALLDVLERTRAIRQVRRVPSGISRGGPSPLGELRSAQVALEEAKLNAGDVLAAVDHVRRLERRILHERRSMPGRAARHHPDRPIGGAEIPDDTAYVTFAVVDDRLIGVRRHRSESVLSDLGTMSSLAPSVRAQRTALRHLADRRRAGSADAIEQLRAAAERLDARLLAPLGVGDADRVVLTPPGELHQVAWAALPSLIDRPSSLTPTLDAWLSDVDAVTVRETAFLGGPRLASSELEALGRVWRQPGAVAPRASCAAALAALQRADLVHIAAHGSFRSDNPFFSALEFEDGQLALLEIAELDASPAVVVLASCDAAQSALLGDDVAIGTAAELRRIGAHAVVAPAAPVSDDAASQLFIDLHDALVAGAGLDEAMVRARQRAVAGGDRYQLAAASAIQLFAGRSSRRPIVATEPE